MLNAQGAPIEGARLLLAGRSGFRSAETDVAGASRIGGLAPDHYALRVSRAGFQAKGRELDLALRGDLPVEVVLAPSRGVAVGQRAAGSEAPSALRWARGERSWCLGSTCG